jgi:hypothetical protein
MVAFEQLPWQRAPPTSALQVNHWNGWKPRGLMQGNPREQKHETSNHYIDRAYDGGIGFRAIANATSDSNERPGFDHHRNAKGRPCLEGIEAKFGGRAEGDEGQFRDPERRESSHSHSAKLGAAPCHCVI